LYRLPDYLGFLFSVSIKSFLGVSAPDPDTSGFGTAFRAFLVFFRPQKVHYNALFSLPPTRTPSTPDSRL
jgi:hypothetical protein